MTVIPPGASQGCTLCEQGAKMVLFITGACPESCYYCPISPRKKNNDLVFANEMPVDVERLEDMLLEGDAISALGTGVTGGDPLCRLDRVVDAMGMLKEHYGKEHHIHLYTHSVASDEDLVRLKDAGLDEIRFHILEKDLGTPDAYLDVLTRCKALGLLAGVEIPCLPDHEEDYRALIPRLPEAGAAYLNLNELEFTEQTLDSMRERGFTQVHELSCAIDGSADLGYSLQRFFAVGLPDFPIHVCLSTFKDGVQLRNRLKRRAETMKRPFDIATEDGTLIFGVIEDLGGRKPKDVLMTLQSRYEVPKKWAVWVKDRQRIELASWVIEEIADLIGMPSAVVEEYPTWDHLEVERTPLP